MTGADESSYTVVVTDNIGRSATNSAFLVVFDPSNLSIDPNANWNGFINAFNVKQTVKEGATTIEFTPAKSGKIEIICGMNMGKGSFTVVDPK